MKYKANEKIDLPDGDRRARLAGNVVSIHTLTRVHRFTIDYDSGPMNVSVYITVKDGWATVELND